MKILLVSSFLTLGLLSCSCTKKEVVTPVLDSTAYPTAPTSTTVAKPTSNVIVGEDWSFTLSSSYEKKDLISTSKDIKAVYVDKENHSSVFMVREPYVGEYKAYVIESVRGLKESRVTIKSARQLIINDSLYVVLETEKDNIKLWFWITHNNEVGYTFSCGGPSSEAWHESVCETISQTVKLK